MEIHFQIKFQENRYKKNYNDWIIYCDLTKIHHFIDNPDVFRDITEINFRKKFQKIYSVKVSE